MKKIFGLLACIALVACSQAYQTPVLSVDGGQIAGVALENGVALYKGIPYAAAPVGELRWKKPQTVEPWEGVRVCDTWGPASLQGDKVPGSFYVKEFYMDGDPERSEDCLYLNVWTPAAGKTDAKLPVMLWIHGGAFLNGWGYEIEFGGEAFAAKDVILVTINYRLGMCRFHHNPHLTSDKYGNGAGHYGIWDNKY